MKSIKQQVADALWYLEKPGQTIEDESKAIEILSHIAFGTSDSIGKLKQIQRAGVPLPFGDLSGRQVAIIPGHEPGGGAPGERAYNKKVAGHQVEILRSLGADVFYYEHSQRSYSARQMEMRYEVKKAQPRNEVCWELHYDHVSYESALGHDFFYYSERGRQLATITEQLFSSRFPNSVPRGDRRTGIRLRRYGNGAGFLRQAPGVAILAEPFFRSNPPSWDFFKNRHEEIASIYASATAQYLINQND